MSTLGFIFATGKTMGPGGLSKCNAVPAWGRVKGSEYSCYPFPLMWSFSVSVVQGIISASSPGSKADKWLFWVWNGGRLTAKHPEGTVQDVGNITYRDGNGVFIKDECICPNSSTCTLKMVHFYANFILTKLILKNDNNCKSFLRILSVQSCMVKVVHGSFLSIV